MDDLKQFFSPNTFVFFPVYLKILLKDFVLICLLALALKLECFRDVIAPSVEFSYRNVCEIGGQVKISSAHLNK